MGFVGISLIIVAEHLGDPEDHGPVLELPDIEFLLERIGTEQGAHDVPRHGADGIAVPCDIDGADDGIADAVRMPQAREQCHRQRLFGDPSLADLRHSFLVGCPRISQPHGQIDDVHHLA